MSAALTADCLEPEPNDPSVREWLERVTASGGEGTTGEEDPLVATVCAAAVDPLEIAAALETAGMSHQVVNDTYGHPDVFTLARQLWVQVPFQTGVTATPLIQRPGGWRDLARGALYAAPAVILFALMRALHLELAWWTLPLALTWGWGLGQITAYCGYTLRGRGNAGAEAETGGWLLGVAVASTIDIAAVAAFALGGDVGSVLVPAGVTTYMVAGAILLLHDEEWLAAVLLAPAAVGTTLVLVAGSNAATGVLAVGAILGSAVVTVIGAARHLRFSWRGDFGLGTTDVRIALAHLAHGVICGVALSVLAIEGARIYAGTVSPALIALPLLLTLGVMEWQLRTYKAGVGHLMRGHDALEQFRPMAWLMFQRSLGIYLAASLIASAVVVIVIHLSDQSPPYNVLASQVVLGAAYFLDLTIVSVGRLDLVLYCWLLGGIGALLFAAGHGFEAPIRGDVLAWRSAFVAVVVTVGGLLFYARRVVPAAISH